MAGSKKHKWISVSKNTKGYFGRSGFKRHPSIVKDVSVLNVGDLDGRIENLTKSGKAEHKSGVYSIDLSNLGVNKLLGSGRVSNKIKVTVACATKKAIEKIEAAKGSVDAQASDESEAFEDAEQEAEGGKEEAVEKPK